MGYGYKIARVNAASRLAKGLPAERTEAEMATILTAVADHNAAMKEWLYWGEKVERLQTNLSRFGGCLCSCGIDPHLLRADCPEHGMKGQAS